MIKYNIKKLLKIRGIGDHSKYLTEIGIARHTAFRLLKGEVTTLNLNYIEILCEKLLCEPNDLLVYIPNKGKELPEDHPLQKLNIKHKPKIDEFDWKAKFDQLSISEIQAFTQKYLNENSD